MNKTTTTADLLEMAAKAMQAARHPNFANFSTHADCVCLELGSQRGAITRYWAPQSDPGDAFVLAVTLGIQMTPFPAELEVFAGRQDIAQVGAKADDALNYGMVAAACLSVLRAAAQIGSKL